MAYHTEVVAGKVATILLDQTELEAYIKYEFDDDAVYRKTRSLGVKMVVLEQVDLVFVMLKHLATLVMATKAEIEAWNDIKKYKMPDGSSELRAYYPVKRWHLVKGDPNWYERYMKIRTLEEIVAEQRRRA